MCLLTCRARRALMEHAAASSTALRIPPSDGSAPRLASRRTVLLDAMKLAQEHTIEGNDERGARMDAVVTTLRELIAVAERARGTLGRA